MLLWSCLIQTDFFVFIFYFYFSLSVYSIELNGLIMSMLKVDPQDRPPLQTILLRLNNLAPTSSVLNYEAGTNIPIQM